MCDGASGLVTGSLVSQALPHQADMMLQRVEHVHVRFRHVQVIGTLFQSVQALGQCPGGGIGGADIQFRLQKLELVIDAKDTVVYDPLEQQRVLGGTVDTGGRVPEPVIISGDTSAASQNGEVALQERLPTSVVSRAKTYSAAGRWARRQETRPPY